MCDEEADQRGPVYTSPHRCGQAVFPASPQANCHGKDPGRFGCGEKQEDTSVGDQGQHDPAPLLGGYAVIGQVSHHQSSLFIAIG